MVSATRQRRLQPAAPGPGSTGCEIAGGDLIPFTFVEGPSTLHYGRTVESSLWPLISAITLACDLAGPSSPPATCSGSTSLAAGFSVGPLQGPMETTVAPHRFAEVDVEWGILTLAQPPLTTTTLSSGRIVTSAYFPAPETGVAMSRSGAGRPAGERGGLVACSLVAALAAVLI
ncbi:hypothetical protein AAE478_010516 [Parahypoxylon ruwenzoriense]